jgi:hypothetical protein
MTGLLWWTNIGFLGQELGLEMWNILNYHWGFFRGKTIIFATTSFQIIFKMKFLANLDNKYDTLESPLVTFLDVIGFILLRFFIWYQRCHNQSFGVFREFFFFLILFSVPPFSPCMQPIHNFFLKKITIQNSNKLEYLFFFINIFLKNKCYFSKRKSRNLRL